MIKAEECKNYNSKYPDSDKSCNNCTEHYIKKIPTVQEIGQYYWNNTSSDGLTGCTSTQKHFLGYVIGCHEYGQCTSVKCFRNIQKYIPNSELCTHFEQKLPKVTPKEVLIYMLENHLTDRLYLPNEGGTCDKVCKHFGLAVTNKGRFCGYTICSDSLNCARLIADEVNKQRGY